MNTNLILRSLTSPFPTPYGDVTKGSVLSHADVDNNFIYLKGEVIYTAETNSGIVTLKKLNGSNLSFNVGTGGTGNEWGHKNFIRDGDVIDISTDYQYFIYGDLTLDSGGTINNSGDVVILNGAFINNGVYTSSGGTLEVINIPNITGGTGFDVYVTGGTYNNLTGTATYTNNTGGTFNISGFVTGATGSTDTYVTGGTYNITGSTLNLTRNDNVNIAVTGFTSVGKYVETVFLSGNTVYTVIHNLGLDISVNIKDLDNNELINVNISNYQPTSVDLQSIGDINARVIIFG